MKYEWKKGDKLRVIDANDYGISNGDIVTAGNNVSTDRDEIVCVDIINVNGTEKSGYYPKRFEKISVRGIPRKVVPEDLHLVLIDSCKNFVAVKENYNDAVDVAKGESEAVTVYKLVEVAKVSTTRVVKKVAIKRVIKRKRKRK